VSDETPNAPEQTQESAATDDESLSWDDAFNEVAQANAGASPQTDQGKASARDSQPNEPAVQSAMLQPLKAQPPSRKGSGDNVDLDFILDIPLQVTVEIGRARLLVNDLLQLGQGSVIELSKLVGDPLDILVNDKVVARGEIVVVNDRFGVRLTDIVSPMERVQHIA